MRMEKLTIKSQEAVQEAQRLAERKGNQEPSRASLVCPA